MYPVVRFILLALLNVLKYLLYTKFLCESMDFKCICVCVCGHKICNGSTINIYVQHKQKCQVICLYLENFL